MESLEFLSVSPNAGFPSDKPAVLKDKKNGTLSLLYYICSYVHDLPAPKIHSQLCLNYKPSHANQAGCHATNILLFYDQRKKATVTSITYCFEVIYTSI